MKYRLQAANNSSEIIDYSAPVERVTRLLDETDELNENVEDKIQWMTEVMEKTAEFNTAIPEMEEWLPEVEKSVESMGPMSTDLDIIKDQIKTVQVRFNLASADRIQQIGFYLKGKIITKQCYLGNVTRS